MSRWTAADSTIWGTWLPFIGFRQVGVDDNGELIDPTKPGYDPNGDYDSLEVFCLAWLDWCVIIRNPF